MTVRAILLACAFWSCLAVQAQQLPDPELRNLLLAAVSEADSFSDRYDAEVWLVDMSTRLERKVADPVERLEILRQVHREAQRAQLEPELVLMVRAQVAHDCFPTRVMKIQKHD